MQFGVSGSISHRHGYRCELHENGELSGDQAMRGIVVRGICRPRNLRSR